MCRTPSLKPAAAHFSARLDSIGFERAFAIMAEKRIVRSEAFEAFDGARSRGRVRKSTSRRLAMRLNSPVMKGGFVEQMRYLLGPRLRGIGAVSRNLVPTLSNT